MEKYIDLYSNGNKRLVGSFINGKLKEIKFYRKKELLKERKYINLENLIIDDKIILIPWES
ncbi:hypothetical protein [Polaribacter uvawellassae]|uniref:hypothetical protein n=1 Tax=Polaribacter uvawellassae TaxID=3133495 RepID=UPI0032191DEB